MSNAAYFRVSFSMLEELLLLPKNWRVRRITSETCALDEALLVVEGPEFPEVVRGEPLSEVRLIYEKVYDKSVFSGWQKLKD